MCKINFQRTFFLVAALLAIFFVLKKTQKVIAPNASQIQQAIIQNANQNTIVDNQKQSNQTANINKPVSQVLASGFAEPLADAASRVTKKPFGIYITPKTSPVEPERFQGYHTGADFETFPEEADVDVAVHAVCDGKLIFKDSASGYGGVAVESCTLEGKPITVIYGHLKLESITLEKGSVLNTGQQFAILGKGNSQETDGERKHLHLGFHHGTSINILGYVQTEAALPDSIDPCSYVCGK